MSLRDLSTLMHLGSSYLLSNIITYGYKNKIDIDQDTYLLQVCNPQNPVANLLIIQGGADHRDCDNFCVNLSMLFTNNRFRVFIFGKTKPVVDYRFGHDIHRSLQKIRQLYEGKLITIGFSMGGILLYSYLAYGYDDADLYISTCAPLNLHRFDEIIRNNSLFRIAVNESCKAFGVKSIEELYQLAGISEERNQAFIESFITRLRKTKKRWTSKLITIVGKDDPLTREIQESYPDLVPRLKIVNGWHCSLDCMYYAMSLPIQMA